MLEILTFSLATAAVPVDHFEMVHIFQIFVAWLGHKYLWILGYFDDCTIACAPS